MLFLIACEAPVSTGEPEAAPLAPRILAGPDDVGFDAALAQKAEDYDRQMLAINGAPFGMSLVAFVTDREPVDDWIATGSGYSRAEFEIQAGTGVYDVVYHYDEMGDLGMFGGVAAVAECWRYALLRDDHGAMDDDVDLARVRFEGLLRNLHAMQAVTGRSGSLVRGLADPDQPGMEDAELVPLADEDGNPLPEEKSAVWREDFSGEFPEFVWMDDTSKDQWLGYILALGAAWEVAQDDPRVDPGLVADLEADALAMGQALQVPSEETGLDLTLIDADGRPTNWHDLNAREFEGVVVDEPFNPFNAWAALAGLRVLATVSGDDGVEAFYEEVAVGRGYAELTDTLGPLIYLEYLTNYSNVNMAWVAALSLLRFEEDEGLRETYLRTLEGLWAEGTHRAPSEFHGAWYGVIRAAVTATDDAEIEAALADLRGWPDAPYWNEEVVNCDAEELAVGACIAVDGVTPITLYGEWEGDTFVPGASRGASPVAETVVPRSVRPPSDFEWRSDPYRVNEGGGDRLNPGGDFRAAYWTGRYLRRGR